MSLIYRRRISCWGNAECLSHSGYVFSSVVQEGEVLCQDSKESLYFHRRQAKVSFLNLINPSFCGGGFSLIVVGELRASEYSLGGLEWRVDSW
jgi:hypothetical protein